MSTMEILVEELKHLPPHKLAMAVHYIHELRETTASEKLSALKLTGGWMSAADADGFERSIEEGCGRVDENEWK